MKPLLLAISLLVAAAPTLAADTLAARIEGFDPARLELASVNAAASLLETDTVIVSKNADRIVPIASVTKLMMAMVVLDSGEPLDEWLRVLEREKEAPNNAWSRIRIGSELPRGRLLKIALMASENLAAHVLASYHPGGRVAFVQAMNDKAESLGMTRTRFVDPSGLSPNNRSTAADLLKMVKAAYGYERIREYTTSSYHRAHFRRPHYHLVYGNTNALVSSERWQVEVSKTGYLTEAGRCLVMITRIEGEPVAMALLDSRGTRTPLGDAGRIRRWLLTGDGGGIAAAARRYEQEKNAQYEQASAAE